MEEWLANPYAIFFITGFFMLVQNRDIKKKINSNIIVLYIIFSLICIFSVGSFWKNTIVVLILMFIEIEILSTTEARDTLIVSARYKLIDFIFIAVNKYKIISMWVIIFLFNMSNLFSESYIVYWVTYVLMIAAIFLWNIGRIYKNEFEVKNLDEIEKDYLNAMQGYKNPKRNEKLKEKLDLLLEIEDRTFEHRRSSHTILCWESLVYKLNKDYDTVDKINEINSMEFQDKLIYALFSIKKIVKLGYKVFVVLVKGIFSKQGLKRYLNRGYSTIEMQLIRTYGVVAGYEKTYIRKIYELLYANIFFKSYRRKSKHYHYLEDEDVIKYRIPYAYLNSVRTFINGVPLTSIKDYYKKVKNIQHKLSKEEIINIVNKLSIEEIFIFILGLSKKKINNEIITKYVYYIEKYNLDVRKLKRVIKKISK